MAHQTLKTSQASRKNDKVANTEGIRPSKISRQTSDKTKESSRFLMRVSNQRKIIRYHKQMRVLQNNRIWWKFKKILRSSPRIMPAPKRHPEQDISETTLTWISQTRIKISCRCGKGIVMLKVKGAINLAQSRAKLLKSSLVRREILSQRCLIDCSRLMLGRI